MQSMAAITAGHMRVNCCGSGLTHIKNYAYAPLTDITITVDGKIGLCCRDYKHSVSFADLNTMSAEEAFTQPALLDAYERLSKGDRFLEICKRCTIYRDWRGGCDGVRYLPPGGTK